MNEPTETAFVRMATAFIDQANAFSREAGQDVVATALMHAAARYIAFAAASGADSRDAYATERDAAVNHFAGQFREVIAQHYDDYAAHYNAYLGRN